MRTPSRISRTLRWWSEALAGGKPIVTHEPQAGFYKRKLVKGGPWVAARIWLHQEIDPETGQLMADEVLRCEVGGRARDPVEQWTWLCNEPISQAEYEYLMASRTWAAANAPHEPVANPMKPVDHNLLPIPF